jgi:CRISPR-associated protein Csb1
LKELRMNELESTLDAWLEPDGPAALVIREHLMPVEGPDGVIFPATYAASADKTFKGGYNIDELPDGRNVCLIDSVGSQANRIEPRFAEPPYDTLVPQLVIVAGDKRVNLLDAGHRAGDAIARCSGLADDLKQAFKAVLGGDAEPLARIAPTSLVFGVWDSRDTQAKLPRLLTSTVRAYDVHELHRSAQYVPAADYVESGMLDEPTDKTTSDLYSSRGFKHAPASWSHGGVIATGGVRRDSALHLVALRQLRARDEMKRRLLQRYILGLAAVAFTMPSAGYFRQGCNLVLDPEKPTEFSEVRREGSRRPSSITHEQAIAYAENAAAAFGIGARRDVPFDKNKAKEDVSPDGGGKKAKSAKKAK